MSKELVLVEKAGTTALLTFNEPDRANAMSVDLAEHFHEVAGEIAQDPDLRAVVITGAGRHFSAGGDLDMLERLSEGEHNPTRWAQNVQHMRYYYARFLRVREIGMPVIAAINGSAVGAGLCLALACDMRVVADDAQLGFTFTRLGLHPGLGATYFLPRLVGPERAFMLLTTGRVVDAATALRMGLASSSHPRADLLDAALRLANEVAIASPMAVRQVKESLATALGDSLETRLQAEAEAQSHNYASGQVTEGVSAVRGRRRPAFAD